MPSMRLEGDPSADPPVWIEWQDHRIPTAWPPGYTATFAPGVEILDPGGVVVGHQGDDVNNNYVWPGLTVCPSTVRVEVFRDTDFATSAP
jgi:hypothetical protein